MSQNDSSALVVTTIVLAAAMVLIVIGTLSNLGLPSYALIVAGIVLAMFAAIRYVRLMKKQGS
ncbi:MAG: hypothetical protein JJU31_10060 [Wenzhouxiangella sp.]|nr:hypothetical protein [Wenzhouxiangella sp.]MCH8477085.1 hypothetical protein [Wenzhouxiangella sp.]TVR94230.1 MAG: hypothetical protein EA418_10710 [Wenzhouxiangellaceae bacterium]